VIVRASTELVLSEVERLSVTPGALVRHRELGTTSGGKGGYGTILNRGGSPAPWGA